jgi:hypothetical protein
MFAIPSEMNIPAYLQPMSTHRLREELRLSIERIRPLSRLQKVILVRCYRYDLGGPEEQERDRFDTSVKIHVNRELLRM